jgi:hypothetical protein
MSGRLAQVADSVVRVCASSLSIVGFSPSQQAGECEMSVFSDAELAYLAEGKLGRLATIDGAGMPHVVPLGWRYNPELDTIDIGGRISAAPGNSATRSTTRTSRWWSMTCCRRGGPGAC